MPFDAILAQDAPVGTLLRALRSGRVHHAYLFEGPEGVGKELAAMALAQALVCIGGDPLGCGACSACRRAVTFPEGGPRVPLHPDVIAVERALYPPETLGRSRPEAQEISVDQVRSVVLSRVAFPPHEGRARVFLIRRADELSTSAANALLKTLEEPGRGTYFVLLSSRPERLPGTIRSRALLLRFAPLPDDVVSRILRGSPTGAALDEARLPLTVELAAGSASAALALARPETSAARDAFLHAVEAASRARDLAPAVRLAEELDRDKRVLRDDLRALAGACARDARRHPDDPRRAAGAVRRFRLVARALRELERNVSPSLLMLSLLHELRRAGAS